MRTYRSPLRLFAFGLVGIILIVAAIDVMFGHWLSTAPEDTNGELTTRGQAQQRGDILWGAAMVGAGTLLVGGAVVELVRRKSLVVVTADGLVMAIGHHEEDVVAPWSVVEDVTSDTVVDPYDGATRDVLVVALNDRTGMPDEPLGATWSGDTLLIDAHDWTRRVTDVALSAQGALGHHRRVEEIKQMGPPSVEWDSDGDDLQNLEPDALVAAAGGAVATTVRGDDVEQTVSETPHPDAALDVAENDAVAPGPTFDDGEHGDDEADDSPGTDDGPFGDASADSRASEVPVATAAVIGSALSDGDEQLPEDGEVPTESEVETEDVSRDGDSQDGGGGEEHGSDTDDHSADESVDGAVSEDEPERVADQPVTVDEEPEAQPDEVPTAPPTIAGAFGAARFGTQPPTRSNREGGHVDEQRSAEDGTDDVSIDDEAGHGVAP